MGDELTRSEHLSSEFYAQLGVDGLSARTEPERGVQIVSELENSLSSGSRVLDLGCGYGRIAVPSSGDTIRNSKVSMPQIPCGMSCFGIPSTAAHPMHAVPHTIVTCLCKKSNN